MWVLLLCVLAFPAVAADADSFAVVDLPRVLRESTAAEGVRQQLEEARKNFQNQIAEAEQQLRAEEKKLREQVQQDKGMNVQAAQRQLEQKVRALDAQTRARQKALLEAFDAAMGQVRDALQQQLDGLATERSLKAIFLKEQTLWQAGGLDMTDDVLQRLNTALPRVAVDVSDKQKPPVAQP
ncbi:MAG: OmpH family outer membrane protein [Alphaproteobacteria bacterium]|nr:OmpH family outer membrane protein [Alphaproteobacteria bacterium]